MQTYKHEIPLLFRSNAVLITTGGMQVCMSFLTADIERFMHWRTTHGAGVAPRERARTPAALMHEFTVFGDTGSGIAKSIVDYRQFHATRKALASTFGASRAGMIEHTKGGQEPVDGWRSVRDSCDGSSHRLLLSRVLSLEHSE